jgi:hypothetical protein
MSFKPSRGDDDAFMRLVDRYSGRLLYYMAFETVLPLISIIATVCSVFLYIRAKSVNLLQVHERLQTLEEMVKVLLAK